MEAFFKQVNDLQNILSSINIKEKVQLPEIVVVGEQSSGKSSVLQSIIGIDFLPKGTDIVTRCPIRVRMQKIQENKEYATIEGVPDQEFSFSDLNEQIRKRTSELVGETYISDKEITVNLYSPNMTYLTLVDLPGLIKIAVKNQPRDIVDMIERLVYSKVLSENVLILAISPCTTDIANSSALQMAKKVDPHGERTIGVFTKLDRIEVNPIKYVREASYQLKLGYIGVICRSQREIDDNVTIEQQLENELKFFEENKEYNDNLDLFTIKTLKSRLVHEFKTHLKSTLPKIEKEAKEKLEDIDEKLKEIGEFMPENTNFVSFAHATFEDIFKKINDYMDGSLTDIDVKEVVGGALFRECIQRFHKRMNTKTVFKIYDDMDLIAFNSGGIYGSSSIPFKLIYSIVTKKIRELKPKIVKFLDNANTIFGKFIEGINHKSFSQFENFKEVFYDKFKEVKDKNYKKTLRKINQLVEVECNGIDPDLDYNYLRPKEGRKGLDIFNVYPREALNTKDANKKISNDEFDTDLHDLTLIYFLKARESLDETIPKIIKYFFIFRTISETKLELQEFINSSEYEILSNIFIERADRSSNRKYLNIQKDMYEKVVISLRGIKYNFN